jgi:putative MATE family efflux protein
MSTTVQTVREPSAFWPSLRDAMLGARFDYTQGSITRAITLLAVPMVLEMMMESLFGIVDVFFIAHLGADAVATVGLTESLITPLFAIALGLSMGTTAIVARRIGEKRPEEASIAAAQALIVGVVISAIIGVTGFLAAPNLLRIMGATHSIVRTGSGYTRTIFGGSATIFFLFLINAVFRGAGDASIAMRALWLANLINILLNPCLILGLGPFPRLGITGSAIGTTIGRGTGVLFQLWMLSNGRTRVRVRLHQVRADFAVMAKLIRLSVGGMLQYFVNVASWIALVRMAAMFGPAAIAGYTLAIRIIVFGILPSWGMSNAAATMVGQNLGAKRPDRAERSVWLSGFYNMLFLGTLGLVFILFAKPIVSIFTDHAALRQLRLPGVCLRDGHRAVVQRRGRYPDTDDHQPVLLLAAADSAGMVAGISREARRERGFSVAGHLRIDDGRGRNSRVPPWNVETDSGVTGRTDKIGNRCRRPRKR